MKNNATWKRYSPVALCICFLCVTSYGETHAAPNTLTDEQEAAGWQLLFDGESPEKQWRAWRHEGFPGNWQVKEGGWLVVTGGGGDIMTREKFESFELEWEWKVEEQANSGVFYMVQDDVRRIWHAAPEYQILDNARFGNPKHQAGALYDVIAPVQDVTRPVGEINQARLVVDGPRITHYLNGHQLLTIEVGSDEWDYLVADTKFRNHPFAEKRRGRIALQEHGGTRVAFRNIRIRPLNID